MRRVLESLVAVNDPSGHVFMLFKGFGKGLQNQLVIISKADVVGYNFVVKQVFNGGEIEPRILYTVLRHIRYPFLMGLFPSCFQISKPFFSI
jgi:hypothetical protein